VDMLVPGVRAFSTLFYSFLLLSFIGEFFFGGGGEQSRATWLFFISTDSRGFFFLGSESRIFESEGDFSLRNLLRTIRGRFGLRLRRNARGLTVL
jgi:hypothetical protein